MPYLTKDNIRDIVTKAVKKTLCEISGRLLSKGAGTRDGHQS